MHLKKLFYVMILVVALNPAPKAFAGSIYPIYFANYPMSTSYFYQSESGAYLTGFDDDQYPVIGWHNRPFSSRIWVDSFNGDVPDNAIIYENSRNTKLLYYCRGVYKGQFYYGELVPNEGCYIGDPDHSVKARLFTSYQVMIE